MSTLSCVSCCRPPERRASASSSNGASTRIRTHTSAPELTECREALTVADANLVAVDDELSRARSATSRRRSACRWSTGRRSSSISSPRTTQCRWQAAVELAQLEYNLARMRGLWSHLERLGGGVGTRGPGETQIETDRRLARDRISALKRKLAHVGSTREVMRAERDRAQLPQIALAGYTNAGKSNLLNALTGADVGVWDRLSTRWTQRPACCAPKAGTTSSPTLWGLFASCPTSSCRRSQRRSRRRGWRS